jgi:hypothetical protein
VLPSLLARLFIAPKVQQTPELALLSVRLELKKKC